MRDPRINKFAAVLVHYSAAVKKGDLVRIGGQLAALPLIGALYEQTLQAGANPLLQLTPESFEEAFFRLASEAQLSFANPLNQFLVENINVHFEVRAPDNTRARSNVPPARQSLFTKARKPFLSRLMERAVRGELRWTLTQFPAQASAQDADMSLIEYEEFIFNACLLHHPDPVSAWKVLSEKQQRLVDFLDTKKEIRIIARDTDLRLGIAGRKWINCDGHANFPDGEVFTGPIETATEGTIRYTFPAIHRGRECHDIRLTFKAGKVIDASASKGQEYLLQTLDLDAGARILGELAIGSNFGVTQFTKNILFDEKIGGTCHLALGKAYPESGGVNDSALHWDMVCDLRVPEARIEADGQTLLQNGRFLSPEYPAR